MVEATKEAHAAFDHVADICGVKHGRVFATVLSRTRKARRCLNRKMALAMVFRLTMSARKG